MPQFNVTIARVSVSHKTLLIEAPSEQEATDQALAQAGDHTYSEKSADYEVADIERDETP